jgi:hypothetical protein
MPAPLPIAQDLVVPLVAWSHPPSRSEKQRVASLPNSTLYGPAQLATPMGNLADLTGAGSDHAPITHTQRHTNQLDTQPHHASALLLVLPLVGTLPSTPALVSSRP